MSSAFTESESAPTAVATGEGNLGSPAHRVGSAGAERFDHLDATRAFALVLGVVFHAALSFQPGFLGWAVQDVSTSPLVSGFTTLCHAFRMELFFLIAGFFSYRSLRRQGPRRFAWNRLLRLGGPLVVGWFCLRPLLVAGWILGMTSLRGDADVGAALRGGFGSLAELPAGFLTGTHLWFLYYLGWVTLLLLAGDWVARRWRGGAGGWPAQVDRFVRWWVGSPVAAMVGAGVVAVLLLGMRGWSVDTPDQSLRPHLPLLALYGGFYGLGAWMARQPELLEALARGPWWRWGAAVLGALVVWRLGPLEADPAHAWYVQARWGYALGYGLAMGSLVGLSLGVFRRWFSRPNPMVRYLSEASYWIYLVHLPLVVWLQVAVAELPWPWLIKLGGISLLAVALALVSYDLGVRSTWVGKWLNGRRQPRAIFVGRSYSGACRTGV